MQGREEGQRSEGRKVRNVEGDPDFWARNGVMGEERTRSDNRGVFRGGRGRNYEFSEGEKGSAEEKGAAKRHGGASRGQRRGGHSDQDFGDVDLRARLSEQLERGLTECMVCLERVRQMQPTWDCHNCYQVG